MCDQISQFVVDGYIHIKDFISKEDCDAATNELKKLVSEQKSVVDSQCSKSDAVYGAEIFEKMLLELLPKFEKASGKRLHPTYSYARLYAPGEVLEIHVDRPSCEVSATITLGFDGDVWPIYMGDDPQKSNSSKIDMNVGDAVMYFGMDKWHWREEYTEGKWQAQVFLHYVDADGPHAEWIFDKRSFVNEVKEPDDMRYRVFNDVLTTEDCDMIVNEYKKGGSIKEPPYIGDGFIDKSIRNVDRVVLPTYKGLGGMLASVGLSANHFNWQFDITHANQAEMLIYPAGGKYQAHVDTFLRHSDECRKLTVLAFLNDQFTGGRFFIQDGEQRHYPPQSKGTVLVFPSFLVHGVEDIQDGERYSAVCWMVGKFFK